jgi:hypothetical protein
MCAPAYAADTLSVFTDNAQIALGASTTIAAHAETDAGFGGGHVAFKYRPGAEQCAADPADDTGLDASGGAVAPVDPGPSTADVGGQMLQLGVGSWRICGWLVDDVTGATVATASTVVTVVPYMGSISLSVKRSGQVFQMVLSYSTSGPARLFATVQRNACSRSPAKIGKHALLLVPRAGQLVGSDGGLGRSVRAAQLRPGQWRVCSWLQADTGAVGPVTKTFSVTKRKPRAGHAAG